MFALNLDTDGRILSATFPQCAHGDVVIVDKLPEGNIADYLYINGEYVYDPIPVPEEPEPISPYVTWDELAAALSEGVNSL